MDGIPSHVQLLFSSPRLSLSDMRTPELPKEVWERVIDFVPYYSDPSGAQREKESVDTLYACALVCRSWLHRSQRHLFATVNLSSASRTQAFLDILVRSPSVGKGVVVLIISPSQGYSRGDSKAQYNYNWIYKALSSLPSFLSGLSQLHLRNLPPLHPSFIPLISRFKTVRVLFIVESLYLSFSEIIRVVNRIPHIKHLQISACSWTRPVTYFARRRGHSLDRFLIQANDDCRRDVLAWLRSSECLSSLRSATFGCIETSLVPELLVILQQCLRTLECICVVFYQQSCG